MKKIISLILSVVIMALCVIPVIAGTVEELAAGLVMNGINSMVQSEAEKLLSSSAVTRNGDVNFDGKITAVDARLCLQIVVSPELVSVLPQGKAADVNYDGKVSAVDARLLLQDIAGTNEIVTQAQTEKGGSLVIGPLRSIGNSDCYWQCDVDKSELSFFKRLFDKSELETVDGFINQYYVFTPDSEGTYTINLKLANEKQTEVVDEFSCVLTVK